ncbi:uncharacterized protein N7459_008649 [Penicillium hispanicum]|uniref:Uncharacterized protein n=1 Tax=Penicillium cinerascens TaxID=70096 RepID=A0A9W9JMR2_9EURO|nr:uncharacterized protein N7459_008649 [Penicillium hispanicum]XP_058307220.1 uncharacterized protein N7498_007909 [Penicillium cinerascens]KAJ5198792.1 hypothetical protein N7498_007909 [Penicillium cinerascens]KAJ5574222.1 hypothetical protein N7459_008649 [Penicillium hispanicum]
MRFTILASVSFISLAAAEWSVASYTDNGCKGTNNWSQGGGGVQDCVTIPSNEASVYVDPTSDALQMYLYSSTDCSGSPTYGEEDAITGCLDDELRSFKVVNACSPQLFLLQMPAMPDKRKSTMEGPSPKRPRVFDEGESGESTGASHERPRNHPVYGQKNAFPGLDDGGDDELFYGPAEDGLEYLRMVRSEASSLPSLFLAPASKQENAPSVLPTASKSLSLPAGFFEDEAYVAPVQTDSNTIAPAEDSYPEAQISYYTLLRHRFLLLRSTLKCTPPATSIAALDDTHPISLPRRVDAARKEWRKLVLSVDPQMVQLACMDLESVLGVLQITARLLSDTVRGGNAELIRRIGAWAWGLLGKCREIGELATEDVGEVRDLGKRAVKILQKVQEAENSQTMEEAEASDADSRKDEISETSATSANLTLEEPREAADGPEAEMPDATSQVDELEAAKARLQARLLDSASSEAATTTDQGAVYRQSRALLDMIITVVGEFFGQRDLLDAREVWVS